MSKHTGVHGLRRSYRKRWYDEHRQGDLNNKGGERERPFRDRNVGFDNLRPLKGRRRREELDT